MQFVRRRGCFTQTKGGASVKQNDLFILCADVLEVFIEGIAPRCHWPTKTMSCIPKETLSWGLEQYVKENRSIVGEPFLRTIIDLAACDENPATMAWLLAQDVDFNKNRHDTPWWFVIVEHNQNPAILRMVLETGVDVNRGCKLNGSALHIAAAFRTAAWCELLVEFGADIHKSAVDGHQPIHAAASTHNGETFCYLLSRGADCDSRKLNGQTPLHLWAQGNSAAYRPGHLSGYSPGILRLILQSGADINACDECGWSAAHVAVHADNEQCLFELTIHGLDIAQFADKLWHVWTRHRIPSMPIATILYLAGASSEEFFHAKYNILSTGGDLPRITSDSRPFLRAFDLARKSFVQRFAYHLTTVCMALQGLRLPTLMLCQIIQARWPRLRQCDLWDRIAAVRHFHERKQRALA